MLLLCCISCSVVKENDKNGTYKIEKLVSKGKAPVIFGTIFSYDTKQPLQVGAVKMDGKIMAEADRYGNYRFSPNRGNYRFSSISVPYLLVVTKRTEVKEGDLIKIDFFLKENHEPLRDR